MNRKTLKSALMASATAVTMVLGGCAQPKMESYLFA